MKKAEKSESFVNSLYVLSLLAEDKVKQNIAIDIFSEYFQYEDSKTSKNETELKTISIYQDPMRRKGNRPVSGTSWSPGIGERISIAYCSPNFLESLDDPCKDGFVFDVTNPIDYLYRLEASSSLTTIQHNPKEEMQIAAGQYDGHIAWWDIREKIQTNCMVSSEGHKDPVYNVIWTNSKTNSELMTTSSDGVVKFWDVRNLKASVDKFIIDAKNKSLECPGNLLDASPASFLEYEMTIPSKYMIGTEGGKVYTCSRKARYQADTITAEFAGHFGPIRCLQRNPNFTKYFLTAGDWSAKIWADDVFDSPVFWIKCGTELITNGCWSTVRPSLFFLSRMDGVIEGWDIIYQQKAPMLSQQIHKGPIHCLAMHSKGDLLLAGQDDGSVSMLNLTESLANVEKEEKAAFLQLLDRETRREKVLEGIQREKKLKQKGEKGLRSAVAKLRVIGTGNLINSNEETEASKAEKKMLDETTAKFQLSIQSSIDARRREGKKSVYGEEFQPTQM